MITFHLASDVLHAASVDTSSTEDANSWRRQNYFEFHELRAHRVKPHAVDNWVTQGRVQPRTNPSLMYSTTISSSSR